MFQLQFPRWEIMYRYPTKTIYRPVGRAVTSSPLEREVLDSNLGPVKSDTVLPTARHRCNILSKGAVLWRNTGSNVQQKI